MTFLSKTSTILPGSKMARNQANRARRLPAAAYFKDGSLPLRVIRIARHGAFRAQHGHEFEELVVVTAGRGVHHVGNESYEIGAGEVFVILPGMTHAYPEAESLSLINILYDMRRLRMPRADLGALPGYHALFEVEPRVRQRERFKNRLKLSAAELARALEVVGRMEHEIGEQEPGHRFHALAGFMQLVGLLARAYSRIREDAPQPVTQISRLLGHLHQHAAETMSVAAMGRMAGMSASTLHRTFKAVTGYAPVDFLIRLRVDRARGLLRAGGMRVTEVAGVAGFEDSNYFARQFRRVTGMSPREYARRVGR